MEYAFIFIMMFGAAAILYGLWIFKTGDINLLPYRRRYVAKMHDKKAYISQVGKFTMIIGCSPLAAGAVGYLSESGIAAGVVFVIVLIAGIAICKKQFKVL